MAATDNSSSTTTVAAAGAAVAPPTLLYRDGAADLHAKTLIVMVGLPARGKSFLSAKLVTYFNWSGVPAKIFNAGERRRDNEGATESGRATFFSTSNSAAVAKRDEIALLTLGEAVSYLGEGGGTIAIFDATNTTKGR
jgi:hypothetical protein